MPPLGIRKHFPPINPSDSFRRRLLLKHPDTLNKPIRLQHLLRMLRHILLARRRLSRTCPILPHPAGPLPAKRRVEDQVVVLEVLVDIARAGELRRRLAPAARVGVAGFDILRDFGAGEEPDLDGLGGPLGGIDAAAVGVEVGAEGSGVGG